MFLWCCKWCKLWCFMVFFMVFLNVSKNSCEVIGTGSLSNVRRCREKTSGKCFALKARHGAPSGVELCCFMCLLRVFVNGVSMVFHGFYVVFTWCWYVFYMVFICFDVHKWASWMHLMQRNFISNGLGVSQNDQIKMIKHDHYWWFKRIE
jgi:hypothetical protein